MKGALATPLLCLVLAAAGCGDSAAESDEIPVQSGAEAAKRAEPEIVRPKRRLPDELVVTDLIKGSGEVARKGDEVTIQYRGIRYNNSQEYENSWDWDEPLVRKIGPEMIVGWERGLPGMQVGGRRQLFVPPDYLIEGGVTADEVESPNAAYLTGVIYVIDLLDVN